MTKIFCAAILSLVLILIVGCSTKVDPQGYYLVEPVDDPFILPYRFAVQRKRASVGAVANAIQNEYVPVDLYAGGSAGMYSIGNNWRPADSLTAILFYADTEEKKTLSQINVNTIRISSHFPYDFDHDSVTEVAVTYTTRDTLWLDIIDPQQRSIHRQPLVVGSDRDGNGFWDGSGTICGVHDFNDDGYGELLVNCDVGYDLYPRKLMCIDWFNKEMLWEYDLAGIVNSEHTYVEPLTSGNKPSIVFGVGSKGNPAIAGDMDDLHSYLIVLDKNGKLQWKRETGGVFSSCAPVLIDYDNDGASDIVTTYRYEASNGADAAQVKHGGGFKIYDMNGGLLDSIDLGAGRVVREMTLGDFDSDGAKEVFVSLSDASIIIYNQRLSPVRKARFYTSATVWDCRDFLGTKENQLLVGTMDNKLWLLTKEFRALAQFGEGEALLRAKSSVYKKSQSQKSYDIVVAGNAGQVNYFLTLVKTPWNAVFSRDPLLAFLAALLPMSLVVALIWFNWHRTGKQKRIISQQRDRLNTALEDLKAAQEKLIAIEEYNKTQEALRASENRYKTLVENLPQRIFLKDKDSTYVSCNQNYARDLRIRPDEIAGKTDYEFYPKELAEKYRADDNRIVESGKIEDIEERYIQDGRYLWVHTVKTPVKDENGNIVGVLGIFWDITDRKRAEEALKESEEKFRTLAEQSPNMIFINKKGRIVWANRRCEEIMGYSREEFYSSDFDFLSLIAPGHRHIVKEMFGKHMKGEEILPYEYALVNKQGKRIEVINSTKLIMYGGDKALLGIITDITERKRAEEELRRHRDHLDELVKHRTVKLARVNEQLQHEITERERAEEELRESEERLSLALEGAGLGMWDHNLKTGKIIRSGRWAEMLGYTLEEIDPDIQTWKSLIHPDDLLMVEEAANNHEAGHTPFFRVEHRMKTKTGNWKWVLNWGKVVERDNEGRPVRALGTHLDITDLKQAEEALRKAHDELELRVEKRTAELSRAIEALQAENEERKRADEALRQSEHELSIRNKIANVFLTVTDDEMYSEVLGVILEATKSKYGVFGYLAKDGALVVPSMTRTIWDKCAVSGKDIVFPRDTWGDSIWPRSIREKKTLVSNELSTKTPEGHIPVFRNISLPIIHQGEPIGLIHVANKETDYNEKDIHLLETIGGAIAPILNARLERDKQESERKQAEEALRSERDFVRSLLDTANSLIVCLDSRARITVFNEECEKVTGYTRKEVIGKSWPEVFLPEEARHDGLENFAEWVRQHPRDMYEGPLKTKSGQIRTILWSNSALFPSDSDELSAIAVGQDITERKEAERKLQVATRERYNQVKQIAGGVAHEIHNALYPATSSLAKLRQRLEVTGSDEQQRNRKLLELTEKAITRAISMTELVTKYSKLESEKKSEPVNPGSLFQAIINENRLRIEDLEVDFHLDIPDNCCCKCYYAHAYSLFNNLMLNALDALQDVQKRSITIVARQEGERLRVEFSDSGSGIPTENIDKIFDAFFSTKPRTGTGLGMAMAKKIVELYDGSIEVNSSLDKGTEFIILL